MAKNILINGFGSGISLALAEKFGAQGFGVGLVARSGQRLDTGVKMLEGQGVRVVPFQADLSDLKAIPGLMSSVREKLGPLDVVQWNAYAGGAGDLLAADPAEISSVLGIAVPSLVAVVQAALPDLRANKGAVLVTNGGLGLLDDQVDAGAVGWKAMGLAVANAAKHKLVRLLSTQLKPDGVYVGEVMVLDAVKGSAWDSGNATLEASAIAAKFWQLYSERSELSVRIR